MSLPIPPENLRIDVGPFSDAELFIGSGEEMVAEIVSPVVSIRMQRSWTSAAAADDWRGPLPDT